jgi:hypothetical protein
MSNVIDELIPSFRPWKKPTVLSKEHFPVTCTDTKEVCYTYKEYLNSKHWQNLKKKFYKSLSFRHGDNLMAGKHGSCFCCKQRKPFHTHHKTYQRLGREYLRDLVALCAECHLKVHETINEMIEEKNWTPHMIMKKKSLNHVRRLQTQELKALRKREQRRRHKQQRKLRESMPLQPTRPKYKEIFRPNELIMTPKGLMTRKEWFK